MTYVKYFEQTKHIVSDKQCLALDEVLVIRHLI